MKLLLLATTFLVSCSHFGYDLDSKKQEDELRDRAKNFRGPLRETDEVKELERSRESFRRIHENGFL